jgi:hypothetical protein
VLCTTIMVLITAIAASSGTDDLPDR